MTVFAILLPTPQQPLVDKIKQTYPNDFMALSETQFLVSAFGTVQTVSLAIGLGAGDNPPPLGTAVVLAISSYWGRAPTTVWDWLKLKLESPPNG